MKSFYSLLILYLLLSVQTLAQLPKKKWFPQKSYHENRLYWAVSGLGGIKRLTLTPTLFALNYDHPSADSLFPNQENITAGKLSGSLGNVFNATFGVEFGLTKSFFLEARADLIFAKPFTSGFEIGVGYNFELIYYENERYFTIRPVLGLEFLSNQIKVGSYRFPPSTPSVAMVEAIFERRADLNFTLKNTIMALKPRLSISHPISERWAIRGDMGWLLVLNKKSVFSISQENINQTPYQPAIDDPRLGFTMNGIRSKQDLFVYSGFFSQLGIVRKFGDPRDNGRRFKYSKRR